jgi:hypothetical protein
MNLTIEIIDAMTKPDSNGTPSLPKRSGPKGLLPNDSGLVLEKASRALERF